MENISKKVLHIITGLNDGGAEGVLYRLCTTEKHNTHVVISMMDGGKYKSLLEEKEISVYCLNMPQGKISLKSIILLWHLIKQLKPDIVQTWMYHADLIGGVVAKLGGIKKIYWGVRHTTLEHGKSKKSTIIIAKINSMLSRFIPNKIIYCAESARKVHESFGYSKQKGVVINNGYDLEKFFPNKKDRAEFRKNINISEDTFLLGMIGRFDPQKDHKNLINALSIVSKANFDFKCLLVGKNVDHNNDCILNWISQENISEKFFLLGQRSDIHKIMNALDLNLLSSSFGEAFPNVLAEAMACGTPCITTDVGDAALIVGDTGWISRPNDPQEFAKLIFKSFEEWRYRDNFWSHRKKAARQRITEIYDIKTMVSLYLRTWDIAQL